MTIVASPEYSTASGDTTSTLMVADIDQLSLRAFAFACT